MNWSIFLQVSVFFGFSILRELDARECICVHDGLVLPVDQHPSVTELTGGTCAEVLNDHVHFKNLNWTLVMYQGHHAFVEKIRTEYDKLKCDNNNVPITTTSLPSTTRTTTTIRPTTPTLTTVSSTITTKQYQTTRTTTVPPPYCPPTIGAPHNGVFSCTGIDFVSRNSWGASSHYEMLNDLTKQFSCAVDFVIIHQTFGSVCLTKSDCIQRLQTDIQNWKHRQFNFAIGNDGTILELNGFHSMGKHAKFFDSISLGIAFIGDFTPVKPSQAAIGSLQKFLACAVNQQLLAPSYVIRTDRDIFGTTGLGDALYKEIEQFEHY